MTVDSNSHQGSLSTPWGQSGSWEMEIRMRKDIERAWLALPKDTVFPESCQRTGFRPHRFSGPIYL